MKSTRTRAKNDVIGSRRSESIILSDFLPQFYQGRVCKYATRLIHLLTQKMSSEGIETRVATGDSDVYIVKCGLEKAISHPIVAITGQDVDLVVLLIALPPPESYIYFMKSGKRKIEAKLFSTRKLQENLSFPQTILLLRAFNSCDITSAIYRKSKPL
ncbi:hypothetical protein AVEN_203215-1 [Araneus ventricosus]|uniref:Uncharacterized protein n=1 Tax=Araneus ventricosus TaxID=182803 RepID=A0A4Y2LFH0_ARAVE|nr:hypothetical protein AVEN_274125-1 [Araneus ventricosus]GBN13531.1 hypothetical protein AVEN_203215-1 [Araneus ventricosus]